MFLPFGDGYRDGGRDPTVIEQIHREYLEAGADIICTNTFGGTPVVLNEYDLGDQAHEINGI